MPCSITPRSGEPAHSILEALAQPNHRCAGQEGAVHCRLEAFQGAPGPLQQARRVATVGLGWRHSDFRQSLQEATVETLLSVYAWS